MNVLSLFDGMSCGQIALERAKIQVENYFASEIDKHAIQITQKNYPNTIQLGDINNWKTWNLPEIDIILAGSPCQGFSFAGKQLNFNDPRSSLFFVFIDILNKYKPEYFLLENVKMAKKYQNVISDILGMEPIEINSNLLSAQNRKRLYWTNIPNVKQPADLKISFDSINSDNQDWLPNEYIERVKNWNTYKRPVEKAIVIGKGQKVPTLTARGYNQSHGGMKLVTDGTNYRYLTNNEAEMSQTVPIDYTKGVSNRERSRMLGNGWTVDIIAHILNGINHGKRED